MSQSYSWEEYVPPNILGAVRHLRDLYEDAGWECSQVTKNLCFAALHPESPMEHLDQYQTALHHLKVAAGRAASLSFSRTLNQGTPPAIFKAYFDLYRALLCRKVELVFEDLLKIGLTHPETVGPQPADWANAQARSLARQQAFSIRNWIRDTCDKQPLETDVDETIYWRSWRAPMFLVMKPCKFTPYNESIAWTRQDEATTLRWLDRFVEESTFAVEAKLNHIVGEAKVLAAITKISTTSDEPLIAQKMPVQPEKSPFRHSPDYRSVHFKGTEYALTRNQAKMIEMLHVAHVAGHAGVTKDKLLAAIEAETSEIKDSFRNCPLWQTLVQSNKRGMYRLVL